MARVIPQYQQQVQVQRSNTPQMETQYFNANNDKATQLAAALGAAQQPLAALRQNQVETVHKEALAWANSTSTDDIAKAVFDKSLRPSESPIFNAAVRNIHGSRALADTVTQIKSDLATGKLKFNSSKEFDAYFTQQRNEFLAGKDNFTVSGYDKAFNEARTALGEFVRTQNDQEALNAAAEQGNAAMNSYIAFVSDPKQFQGTPTEAASLLGNVYDTMVKNGVVAKEVGKKILTDGIKSLIPGGNKDLMDAMLDTRTADGLRVRDIIGADHSALFAAQAKGNFDQQQVKNWQQESQEFAIAAAEGQLTGNKLQRFEEAWARYAPYLSASNKLTILSAQKTAMAAIQKGISEANFNNILMVAEQSNTAAVVAAVEGNTYEQWAQGASLVVPTKDGGTTSVSKSDMETIARKHLESKFAQSDLITRMNGFAQNGIVDTQLQASLSKLSTNLSEVTIGTNGKPQGEVPPEAASQLGEFMAMNKANPLYLKKVVGDSERYDQLELAAGQLELGRSMNEIAVGMSKIKSLDIQSAQFKGLDKGVQDAVTEILSPSWLERMAYILPGFDGVSDMSNQMAYGAKIKKWALFNVLTGASRDPKEAVDGAFEHFKKSSVRVGNVMYLKTDMPEIPADVIGTRTPAEWMDKYVKEVINPIATEAGYSVDKIRLEPTPGGYTAYLAGNTFMLGKDGQVVHIGKKDIGEWARKSTQIELRTNTFDKYIAQEEARLIKKMPKDVQRFGRERLYGTDINPYKGSIIERNKQLIIDNGWDQLPLDEMLAKVREHRDAKLKTKSKGK